MIQKPRASKSHECPAQTFCPGHASSPTDHFTLVFSKIFYLSPVPQPRRTRTGSQVPVRAVGFVNAEQSVRREIMHLSDSLTRNLMSKKTSGVFEMSALSCILITEKYLCRNFTQMQTRFLCTLASNSLVRVRPCLLLTVVPPRSCWFLSGEKPWTWTCDEQRVPDRSTAL